LLAYPDLASVPADRSRAGVHRRRDVPDIVEQCGRKGVKGAVVLALGFSEAVLKESSSNGGRSTRRGAATCG
jgi:acyl-CoA synthetase (NDP forming)